MSKNNIFLAFLAFPIFLNGNPEHSEEVATDSQVKRYNPNSYHKINDPVLKYLDGVSHCLDGNAIKEMLIVINNIKKFRHNGLISIKGKKTALFHNNQRSSIIRFVQLEIQNKNDPELKKSLTQAKKAFIDLTLPFMDRIKGTKKFVIRIMEKSCEYRSIPRNDTVMFEWAKTNGNEAAVFEKEIKSFRDFDKFLVHVSNFVGDLLRSCEKGMEQFKEKFKQGGKKN